MKRILPLAFFMVLYVGTQARHHHVYSTKSKTVNTVNTQNNSERLQGQSNVRWIAGKESMPDGIQAFQEYKGQFLNLMNNDWKIYFGANYEGAKILFTNHGVIYTLIQAVDQQPGDNDGDREEEKKQPKKKLIYNNYALEGENANPNMSVEGIDETPYYFGALNPNPKSDVKGIDHIKGYKKILYHNVYPNIDIEY